MKFHGGILAHVNIQQIPQGMILFFEIKVAAVRYAGVDPFGDFLLAIAEEEKLESIRDIISRGTVVTAGLMRGGGGEVGIVEWRKGG